MKANVVLVLTVAEAAIALAQWPGTFSATGSMTAARTFHRATLLADGKVLITGGNLSIAYAELYDPSTGTFIATGDMAGTRWGHSATLLADGRVLIAGGYVGTAISATTEIYDPATGVFTPSGNMTRPRFAHVATRLADGKVLLAGGENTRPPFPSAITAELYDPIDETFTSTNSYAAGGALADLIASATLMPDGRVLIAGNTEGVIGLFDPATATFGPAGRTRARGSASLLGNGSVLVIGGDDDLGGDVIADVFDPSVGAFIPTGDMMSPRAEHTATLLPDGTVLVTGGDGVGTAELYEPNTRMFTEAGQLGSPRAGSTATLLLDGTVLIAGSNCDCPAAGSAEIYHAAVLVPPPILFSVSESSGRQGAIQHGDTYELVTADNPAVAGEIVLLYGTGLNDRSAIPPQIAIGARMAELLWFGNAPGFSQINVRVPLGIPAGPAVPVRLNYLGRPSNEVTIGVR